MSEAVVAFDAKEFRRTKTIEYPDPEDPQKKVKKTKGFYSPLGVGIYVKNPDIFESVLLNSFKELSIKFKHPLNIPFAGSHELRYYFSEFPKLIAFSDELIKKVQDFIDFVFFSYIVLPPSTYPTIKVGGYKSPEKEVETYEFFRNSSPAFSALTAWAYSNRHNVSELDVRIDSFRYKRMLAWDKLTSIATPSVYYHGDECDPFIATADIIAFLTDIKLYNLGRKEYKYRRLTPDGIKEAWKDYSFETDVWFLDNKSLNFFKWYREDLIDLRKYVKRPIVFFMVDKIEENKIDDDPLGERSEKGEDDKNQKSNKKRKFSKRIRNFETFRAATKYAYHRKGSAKIYDVNQDPELVRDGDIVVYMGENSKKVAKTLEDGYDIEIYKAKEIRKKAKELYEHTP